MTRLRSSGWFVGDDEVALLHRVALRSAGVTEPAAGERPVVGIANSASQLNPCNLPLRELAPAVAQGIREAGGIPVEFPTISLGEDLMKPSAMLYRNLLSIEIEETVRAYPLDALVILANCDKTVPGALMGAASADCPTVLVTGGARSPASFRGRRVGTGTDLWRLWDQRRAGELDDEGWGELERCLVAGRGACNTMGTASTMAILSEVLGFMLPGSSTIPSADPRALPAAREAGRRAVLVAREGPRPRDLLSPAGFENAVRVLHAIGGSTNAVLHLAALAGRVGVGFNLGDVARLGQDVPVLVDVEPSGAGLVLDLDAAGGVPTLLGEMAGLLDWGVLTVSGMTLGEVAAASSPAPPGGVIRDRSHPVAPGPALAVVQGSLAPRGAVVKTSAASSALRRHRGPAVVFRGYPDLRDRLDDPGLEVTPESVLVLSGCGPVGAPGMPEWGMIPIPHKLIRLGVRDMVRVTDARMSGTGFGTVALHVAPEAAVGGPLALVRDGDMVVFDVEAGRLDLEVEPRELSARRAAWSAPSSSHLRGWPALYRDHVLQAPEGCDLDFLTAPTSAHRRFVEPVIGRS